MKISELISILENRKINHGDIDVMVTCEGTKTDINSGSVYKSKYGELYIDADQNFYKDDFAENIKEGEDGL